MVTSYGLGEIIRKCLTMGRIAMWALEHWSMPFDASFTFNRAGGCRVLISPKGDWLLYMIRLHFRTTNNVVEYEAPINGLHIAVVLWF
jgi:ribonuclease HI